MTLADSTEKMELEKIRKDEQDKHMQLEKNYYTTRITSYNVCYTKLLRVEELIPESQTGNETDLSTIGAMLGFATMMLLDVALGWWNKDENLCEFELKLNYESYNFV